MRGTERNDDNAKEKRVAFGICNRHPSVQQQHSALLWREGGGGGGGGRNESLEEGFKVKQGK